MHFLLNFKDWRWNITLLYTAQNIWWKLDNFPVLPIILFQNSANRKKMTVIFLDQLETDSSENIDSFTGGLWASTWSSWFTGDKQWNLTLFFCVVKIIYGQFFDCKCCVDIYISPKGKIWKSAQNSLWLQSINCLLYISFTPKTAAGRQGRSKKVWIFLKNIYKLILFQEEISAYVAVHTGYLMDASDYVWSKIILPCMTGTSFVLVTLTRLNVSEIEHWVTWSHRTDINFPFLRGKRIQYFSASA